MSEQTGNLSIAMGLGIIVGVATTLVIGKIFGPSKDESSASRATISRDREGTSETPKANAGATLTVTTPGPRHFPGALRVGHTKRAKKVALVPTGTTVKVVEDAKDEQGNLWYHVAVPSGHSGWMHGNILS